MNQNLLLSLLEAISVGFNLAFIILLIQQRKSCWIYGILGSLTGAVLFYYQRYYSESILYLFYGLMGVYGWVIWNRPTHTSVKNISARKSIAVFLSGIIVWLGLGKYMSETEADKPYLDALSTAFGFVATFLEIYRYIIGWVYWLLINTFSIFLYGIKGLFLYAALMILYSILSVKGYMSWSNKREILIQVPKPFKFLFPAWVTAMAIWPFVLVFKPDKIKNEAVLNHERIHLQQQLETGFILFYLIYAIEYLFYLIKTRNKNLAYRSISFEQEAYQNDSNFNYLKNRKLYSMWQ